MGHITTLQKKRIRAALLLVCCAQAAWAGSALAAAKTYEYRYKIEITVRERGKLIKSSNVVKVQERAANGERLSSKMCGEALALRLPNGNYLFAVLKGLTIPGVRGQYRWNATPTSILLHYLGLDTEWAYRDDSGIRNLSKHTRLVSLDFHEMPQLIAFKDIRNPRTAVKIDPQHLPEWLGDGAAVESMTLQVSNQPETKGQINKVLPWLNFSQNFIDGTFLGETSANLLPQDFIRCNLTNGH